MKNEEIVVLDNGVDTEDFASLGGCCNGQQAAVR
jgi:hypothetical protein